MFRVWNICNVTVMNNMFKGGKLLTNLPDISKWNIIKVNNMEGMFYGCKSLTIHYQIFLIGIHQMLLI